MAKNDKEVADEEAKYNKLIEKEKAFLTKKGNTPEQRKTIQAKINQQELDMQASVDAIRERQEKDLNDHLIKLAQTYSAEKETELQKELDQINQSYDALAKAAGDDYRQQFEIEAARQQSITNAKLAEEKRLQDEMLNLEEEGATTDADRQKVKLARINAHYDDELADLEKSFSKELKATQAFQDAKDKILGNKAKAIGAAEADDPAIKKEQASQKKLQDLAISYGKKTITSIFSMQDESRKENENAAIQSLENQKNIDLSNSRLTQGQKAAISQKYAQQESAVKLDAWKADQTAAEEKIAIQGAIAIITGLAEAGPFGWAQIAPIIAETALQEAVVASQPTPKFAQGTFIPRGPSHAEGGINLINNQTGQVIGEMEGNEPVMILRKNLPASNLAMIKKLAFDSAFKNGAQVSMSNVNDGIAMARNGALYTPDTSASNNKPAAQNNTGSFDTSAIEKELQLTRQAIVDQQVIFNNTAYEEDQRKLLVIKNAAKF